jgi:hypothetical protein
MSGQERRHNSLTIQSGDKTQTRGMAWFQLAGFVNETDTDQLWEGKIKAQAWLVRGFPEWLCYIDQMLVLRISQAHFLY